MSDIEEEASMRVSGYGEQGSNYAHQEYEQDHPDDDGQREEDEAYEDEADQDEAGQDESQVRDDNAQQGEPDYIDQQSNYVVLQIPISNHSKISGNQPSFVLRGQEGPGDDDLSMKKSVKEVNMIQSQSNTKISSQRQPQNSKLSSKSNTPQSDLTYSSLSCQKQQKSKVYSNSKSNSRRHQQDEGDEAQFDIQLSARSEVDKHDEESKKSCKSQASHKSQKSNMNDVQVSKRGKQCAQIQQGSTGFKKLKEKVQVVQTPKILKGERVQYFNDQTSNIYSRMPNEGGQSSRLTQISKKQVSNKNKLGEQKSSTHIQNSDVSKKSNKSTSNKHINEEGTEKSQTKISKKSNFQESSYEPLSCKIQPNKILDSIKLQKQRDEANGDSSVRSTISNNQSKLSVNNCSGKQKKTQSKCPQNNGKTGKKVQITQEQSVHPSKISKKAQDTARTKQLQIGNVEKSKHSHKSKSVLNDGQSVNISQKNVQKGNSNISKSAQPENGKSNCLINNKQQTNGNSQEVSIMEKSNANKVGEPSRSTKKCANESKGPTQNESEKPKPSKVSQSQQKSEMKQLEKKVEYNKSRCSISEILKNQKQEEPQQTKSKATQKEQSKKEETIVETKQHVKKNQRVSQNQQTPISIKIAYLNKEKQKRQYQLVEKIGKGGFGEVFLTKDDKALKRINLIDIKKDQKSLELLKTQLEAHKQLKHKNIVGFVEQFQYIGKEDGQDTEYQCIVMEKCLKNLNTLLKQRYSKSSPAFKPLSQDEAMRIFRQIIQGYSQLYNNNIVHRDLKGDNILIGKDGECKIADFGLSKFTESSTQMMTTILGTPSYSAPEILAGGKKSTLYTYKCDIWSLGIILYKILTNNKPWPEKLNQSDEQFLQRIIANPPNFDKLKISNWIKVLLQEMLKIQPQERKSLPALVKDLTDHGIISGIQIKQEKKQIKQKVSLKNRSQQKNSKTQKQSKQKRNEEIRQKDQSKVSVSRSKKEEKQLNQKENTKKLNILQNKELSLIPKPIKKKQQNEEALKKNQVGLQKSGEVEKKDQSERKTSAAKQKISTKMTFKITKNKQGDQTMEGTKQVRQKFY